MAEVRRFAESPATVPRRGRGYREPVSRIIAGRAKGRRLATPAHNRTRPTTDRVREALFSTLGSWFDLAGDSTLSGFSFLDLYAGSGAVGLEAASRGADPVWLVESDRSTADLIRTNALRAGLGVQVRSGRVEQTLAGDSPGQPFDIVWLDPPYEVTAEKLAAVLAGVLSGGWIAAQGLFVVERSSRGAAPEWPAPVTAWNRRYGETTLHFAELEE
jgi:16S rRNA (guanine966-N2)-methyltransferase